MKRPIGRLATATIGGFAVIAAASVTMIAANVVGPAVSAAENGWVAPLLAGGAVGLMVWLLLSGARGRGTDDSGPALTHCSLCGAEVLQDWRLCPYCGGSSERESGEGAARNASELGR